MKKQIPILLLVSGLILGGCGGNDAVSTDTTSSSSSSSGGAEYDWTKDPRFAHVIVPTDPSLGFDEVYDKTRVKPYPPGHSKPGSLGERIGYIENQWIVWPDRMNTPPNLYEKLKHRDYFTAWLKTLFPYSVHIMDHAQISEGWSIEVDVPTEKVSEVDASLQQFATKYGWLVEHPEQVLPEWDTPETRSAWRDIHNFAVTESVEFGDMTAVTESGSWHLPYIGMDQLVNRGVNFSVSNIGVGVVDSGLSLGHEDLSGDIVYLDGGKSTSPKDTVHGTAVVGTFSGSVIGNGKGVRGIVQAKTVFIDSQGFDGNFWLARTRIERMLAHSFKPRVVNMSVSLGDKTYYEKMKGGNVFDKQANFLATAKYRELFAAHPDVLFVVAVGNSGINMPWDNSAVHYEYNSLTHASRYAPLENVILVAANGPDNVLHAYSDWGTGLDISAPSNYMTLRCFDGTRSYYSMYSEKEKGFYGINELTPVFSGKGESKAASCDPGTPNSTMSGTSFAAPLVSGAAALLFSADPLLTPKNVKNYLTQNSLVNNRLRYAGEYWKTGDNGNPVKDMMFKPLPILDIAASYDAVIAHKQEIAQFSVSTRNVTISVIDRNAYQDEYFNLVVNGVVIGKIENPTGKSTTYPVALQSGYNLIELRITNAQISNTRLVMKVGPDGIEKEFYGDDISYAWTVKAP